MVSNIIRALVALAVIITASTSVLAADAAQLASFQPFQTFGRGEGEGYARSYVNRTKDELVALLRDPTKARDEMRVTCEVLVRQMVELHPNLPFEGCEGAAAVIEADPAYEVADCSSRSELAVTNDPGTSFGTWERDCLPGEKVLMYNGEVILSLMCMNPIARLIAGTTVTINDGKQAVPVRSVVRARSNPFPTARSCPLDSAYRWLNVSMYAPEAAEHPCAQQYMLPQDGKLATNDPRAREFLKSDMAFATQCGAVIRKSGIALGTARHKVEAFLIRSSDGMEEVFFEGFLQGDRLTANPGWEQMVSVDQYALMIPEEYQPGDGTVVFGFPEHGIRTPTASGFGDSVSKFQYAHEGPDGCHVNQYVGIDLP